MNQKNLRHVATQLWDSHHSSKAIPPIVQAMNDPTLEEAYTIQKINHDKWIAQGERLVGRKIGLTSPAVQKQLGVNQPDYGMLYASMSYGTHQTIDFNSFIQPKIEAEIALVLKRDLTHSQHTIADLIGATDYVLPALEIVDSRIADWKISIYDTIADNGSSAAFVLGSTPKNIAQVDWDKRRNDAIAQGRTSLERIYQSLYGKPSKCCRMVSKQNDRTKYATASRRHYPHGSTRSNGSRRKRSNLRNPH